MDNINSVDRKIATLVDYVDRLRTGHVIKNERMLKSMLDDPEVAEWLDKARKENRVDFTRFS